MVTMKTVDDGKNELSILDKDIPLQLFLNTNTIQAKNLLFHVSS